MKYVSRPDEGLGPGSEFGFENPLRFLALPPPTPKTDPQPVRHTLGFGYNAPELVDSPLPFLNLLSQFGTLPASHNRQVEGSSPSGPTIFDKNHRVIDRYRLYPIKALPALPH